MAIQGFNPLGTSVASGSFYTDTTGYTQGVMEADPAARYSLVAGVISRTDTNIYYGGLPIVENISQLKSNPQASIQLATASDSVSGFTTFNQSNNLFTLGANQVPTTTGGGTINYLRLGCNARISLACDPELRKYIGTPLGAVKVAWDFTNNQLVEAGSDNALAVKVIAFGLQNSKTVTIDQSTQAITWNTTGTCALVLL